MRAVLQRVSSASVTIGHERIAAIERGLLILLGIAPSDTEADARWLAEKIVALRIFASADGAMNVSARDADADLLIVSQFRLFASTRKGTRPSWDGAARPDLAIPLYEKFCELCTAALGRPVATGRFGADMSVALVNDGPFTLIIDSHDRE